LDGLDEPVGDGVVVHTEIGSGIGAVARREGGAGEGDFAQGLGDGFGQVAPFYEGSEGQKVFSVVGEHGAAMFGRIEMGEAAEELDEERAAEAPQDSMDGEGLEWV
jgi:hypothetical protein